MPDRVTPWEACDLALAQAITARRQALGRPILVGLSGSQGSGKSTAAARLAARLSAAGTPTVTLSLDDVYLTRAERADLADRVHPLLVTRGPPGTHDLDLAQRTISALLAARAEDVVPIPRFDKAADDRAPFSEWPTHTGSTQVVVLEGWCVGARPQARATLATPVNDLERLEDPDGHWRAYGNAQLAQGYAALFARLDLSVMFRAPSFEQVFDWRAEQEAGLARTPGRALPPMDGPALRRFIAHYERITRWMLADQPADIVIDLDEARRPIAWREGGSMTEYRAADRPALDRGANPIA